MVYSRKYDLGDVCNSPAGFCSPLLWGLFFAVFFSQAGFGCSKKGDELVIEQRIIKLALRSEVVFDQIVSTVPVVEKETVESPAAAEEEVPLEEDEKSARAGLSGIDAFERDPEYLAIERFEQPPPEKTIGPVLRARREEPGSIQVRDRKLIFAGEGFETEGFEANSSEKLSMDFLSHLKPPPQEHAAERKRDRLDVKEDKIIGKKNLIFHSPAVAFFDEDVVSAREPEADAVVPRKENTMAVERIPETKVLLTHEPKELLKLRPSKESLDLLLGNEKVNKRLFRNR